MEEEQNRKNRTAYGKQILQELSAYLASHFGKGLSVDNLKLIRRFYVIYSNDQIGETVFPQFQNFPATKLVPTFVAVFIQPLQFCHSTFTVLPVFQHKKTETASFQSPGAYSLP